MELVPSSSSGRGEVKQLRNLCCVAQTGAAQDGRLSLVLAGVLPPLGITCGSAFLIQLLGISLELCKQSSQDCLVEPTPALPASVPSWLSAQQGRSPAAARP